MDPYSLPFTVSSARRISARILLTDQTSVAVRLDIPEGEHLNIVN